MPEALVPTPLAGELTVVDLSTGIAGGYCSKLLIDGGACVIKVEGPDGDPLRRRALLDAPPPDPAVGGVLFRFLAGGAESVVADSTNADDVAMVAAMIAGADAVIWSAGSSIAQLPQFSPESLRTLAPRAVVVSLTPLGLVNDPGYPLTEFTLQAMSGGFYGRGTAAQAPLMAGGEPGHWTLGLFGALGLLTAHHRSRTTGVGELLDVSMLDALHLTHTMFAPTFYAASGRPMRAKRIRTIPLIHPTSDGYVGWQITTGQQWLDFCAMIDKPDWAEDKSLARFDSRLARFDEVNTAIDAWSSQRTTSEIVELSVLFRLPVAPVANGKTIQEFDQTVARQWYVQNPGGFTQPEAPYTFTGNVTHAPFRRSPLLGEHTSAWRASTVEAKEAAPTGIAAELPFAGLRIADFTAFWAGPIIGHYFAMLGADVIHVESVKRPDGLRLATLKFDMSEGWCEASPPFAGTNTNKRDLTLDMGSERGRELARALIANCDVMIENYSTRVMAQWGLDYESLRAINPKLIMVRAPGFGNTGPWADRVAYATTIEQASGAAWVTGYADDRPDVAGGVMDPVAGTHASFAILLALEHRRRTGEGVLLEVPQFTSGMNMSAEQVLEYSDSGRLLGRMGNRSWTIAPQGTYRVLDVEHDVPGVPPDEWVAISVETDEQWPALCSVIGADELAADAALSTVAGRRAAHDRIDAAITAWTQTRGGKDAVTALRAAGVPASQWVQLHDLDHLEEVRARGLYEQVDNPVLGTVPIVGCPVRFEHGPRRLHRRHAPLLGEHNREILIDIVGLSDAEVDQLDADGVIGQQPPPAAAWW